MCVYPLIEAVYHNLTAAIDDVSVHFLLACSGGADSTALLLAFHRLQPRLSCRLTAITVNHNIRSAAESAADAHFVAGLCAKLEPPIPCIIEELAVGAVVRCVQERGRGTEDAARMLRYQCLEKAAAAVNADLIVTAHNKSDVYETLLMRLFQGGSTASLQPMTFRRGKYVRPLITVERSAIESFLRQQGVSWREDATNMQNAYLRNRIRHFLVPALTETFGAWQHGLDKTVHRIGLDRSLCEEDLASSRVSFAGAADWQSCKHGALAISAAFFDELHPALRLRLLEHGCLKLGIETRVPVTILLRLSSELVNHRGCTGRPDFSAATSLPPIMEAAHDRETVTALNPQDDLKAIRPLNITPATKLPDSSNRKARNGSKIAAAGNLRMERRGEKILLFRNDAYLALSNQKSYFLTIKACGVYPYPLGLLEVSETARGVFVRDTDDRQGGVGPFRLPITVQSRRGGDRIRMSSGGLKEIKKILNEWNVDSLARAILPIIREDTCVQAPIRALYGGMLGYKNWFVED